MADERTKTESVKQRAKRELEEYLVIAAFLTALLGALTMYRRLLMAEVGVPYLHYGYAVIEGLVLAKIVLIGEALHFAERLGDKPLFVLALYKSLVYGGLALVAHALEHVVHALVTGESVATEASRLASRPAEIGAYAVVVLIALVPFFSLQLAGRLLGKERFVSVLSMRPPTHAPT
jgi:hypothetical protein